MKLKKISIILLTLLLLFSLVSCKEKEEPVSYPDRDVDYPSKLEQFNEDSIQIHYQRSDNKYADWTLWLWDPDGNDDSLEDDFNYQDDFGVIASYPLSHFGNSALEKLGIIVKKKGNWTKDGTESDRFIVFANLKKDENNIYHVYLAGGDEHIYLTSEMILTDNINLANFRDEKTLYISASNPVESFKLYSDGNVIFEGKGAGRSNISQTLDFNADFTKSYTVEVNFRESGETLKAEVSTTGLYSSDTFNELYYYDGELGAIYDKAETVFKVWSPVSEDIELRIYNSGTPKSVSSNGDDTYEAYKMVKGDKGVFEYTLKGDNEGKYYTYFVKNSTYPDGVEITDPYAKSAGISGIRGMIVDFSKTNPEGWNSVKYLDYDRQNLTVWETHVADVTSSKTWTGNEENRHKYLGVIEEGTTYSENGVTVTTGFDHIKELGVNAVQLLPIFDQQNDETKYVFNWGYNPQNYDVLEGMYSSDPYDGYARIREFKQLVKAFNDEGITIIMDVVYNHMNGAVRSPFDVLMPGYYFRYKADGSLSNGSGCGNETASEMPMMRKFIIDSISFWLKEYKLGGFRFDLMGLHDIETMNEVNEAALKINPHAVIYGEPWTGGGTPLKTDLQAIQANANKFKGYGQFNDQMRDALIKGGLHDKSEKGWVNSSNFSQIELQAIANGINGITHAMAYTINDSNKSVSYVTCHDNFTLYDRMKAAGITDEDEIRKMCVLANSVVLTSKGVTFMLAGEEMLRTKQGNSNSYMSSDDVNQLDYSLKVKNLDVFYTYKNLIYLKQNIADLSDAGKDIAVETLDDGNTFRYTVNNKNDEYVIIHHNGLSSNLHLDLSAYELVLDTLSSQVVNLADYTPAPYQTLIVKK